MPLIKPKSPKGKTSILPKAKIKYISAVHLPIPRIFINSEITSSFDIFLKILKSNFLSTIICDISKIYSAFILDNPTDLISSIDNLTTIIKNIQNNSDSFYVLAPVANNESEINWDEKGDEFSNHIIRILSDKILPNLKENIIDIKPTVFSGSKGIWILEST